MNRRNCPDCDEPMVSMLERMTAIELSEAWMCPPCDKVWIVLNKPPPFIRLNIEITNKET